MCVMHLLLHTVLLCAYKRVIKFEHSNSFSIHTHTHTHNHFYYVDVERRT